MSNSVDLSKIEKMIYFVRGQKVMLDRDLAELYGVETKRLNEQVKRNLERFPDDFMFRLTQAEFNILQDHESAYGGQRYLPYVFTENGVAMLSSVLNSRQAIQVNISIMRIFTKLRSFLFLEKDLRKKVDNLEKNTNRMFKIVFEHLDEFEEMVTPKLPPNRKKIGLGRDDK